MFLCLSIRSLPVGNSLSPLTQLTPVWSADQMPPPPGSHLWPHHASTLLLGVCNNAPLPCFRGTLAYLAWCLTHCTVIIWKKKNSISPSPLWTVEYKGSWAQHHAQCMLGNSSMFVEGTKWMNFLKRRRHGCHIQNFKREGKNYHIGWFVSVLCFPDILCQGSKDSIFSSSYWK